MFLKRLFIISSLLVGQYLSAQPAEDITNYINTYKVVAISEMQRTGVPASIKLAQGIHETFAGKSELVLKSNNHFGIKCKATWTGDKVYHDDDARGECFRSYNNPVDSYLDHSNFLRNSARYAFLFKLDPTDYKGWALGLKKAGYATNNHYSQIIIKLIEAYNLQQYSLSALNRLEPGEEKIAVESNNPVEPLVENEVAIQPIDQPDVAIHYPTSPFIINNTKVIFVKRGTPALAIAEQYQIPLGRLFEFNDLSEQDIFKQDQLIFLQRKRKVGANEFHTVKNGERLYDICQLEGIRMESLIEYNHLRSNDQPMVGETLYLHTKAPVAPGLWKGKLLQPVSTENMPKDKETVTNHIVRSNETLFSISKKYGVEMEKLMKWNRMSRTEVKIGQELVIYKN